MTRTATKSNRTGRPRFISYEDELSLRIAYGLRLSKRTINGRAHAVDAIRILDRWDNEAIELGEPRPKIDWLFTGRKGPRWSILEELGRLLESKEDIGVMACFAEEICCVQPLDHEAVGMLRQYRRDARRPETWQGDRDRAWDRIKYAQDGPHLEKCDHCGNKFESRRRPRSMSYYGLLAGAGARYCSQACRQAAYRRRKASSDPLR